MGHFLWQTRLSRIIIKASALFIAVNLLFVLLPAPLGLSFGLYNWLVPGRLRFPYADNPAQSYSLSLNDLDAMFAAHVISQPKRADECRVVVIGDSAVWGVLLANDQTVAGLLTQMQILRGGKLCQVYNLGYPQQSLAKDLLILDRARREQPDLILWLVTLDSFAPTAQLKPLIVRENKTRLAAIDPALAAQIADQPWSARTVVERRRELADWLRLQLYGLVWAQTGIDQVYPKAYVPRMEDFAPRDFDGKLDAWTTFTPSTTLATPLPLAWDLLDTGIAHAGTTPIWIVNEPIFISSGENSEIRYNFFYPRWAYDAYREALHSRALERGWNLLDLWDAVDPASFTDSAVHLTPAGSRQLAEHLRAVIAAP